MAAPRPRRRRAPLLAVGIAALLLGGAGGLARIGVDLPLVNARLVEQHGALLVLGFLGTLIALERAVAVDRRWAFASPLLCAAGAIALMAGLPISVAAALTSAGTVGLVGIFAVIVRLQPGMPSLLLTASSVCAVGAALTWATSSSTRVLVPWLAGFLVLAIAGERLDLARFRATRSGSRWLAGWVVVMLTGIAAAPLAIGATRLLGAGLVGMTAWLARYDVAMRTIRRRGLPRFSAIGLLCGYASLLLAAGAILYDGDVATGRFADIAIHGIFVGFAMSMVMVHAPIIIPSVLRTTPRFVPPLAYAPLAVLQLSLVTRFAGDVGEWHSLVVAGGVGNAVGILGFVVATLGMNLPLGGLWSADGPSRHGGKTRSVATSAGAGAGAGVAPPGGMTVPR
jgi:hypothetical protein